MRAGGRHVSLVALGWTPLRNTLHFAILILANSTQKTSGIRNWIFLVCTRKWSHYPVYSGQLVHRSLLSGRVVVWCFGSVVIWGLTLLSFADQELVTIPRISGAVGAPWPSEWGGGSTGTGSGYWRRDGSCSISSTTPSSRRRFSWCVKRTSQAGPQLAATHRA